MEMLNKVNVLGLLAAAIGEMNGIGGKAGWAWIFILEGLATVLIGIASFWMVFDFPDEANFLTDADRRRVIRRLKVRISRTELSLSTYIRVIGHVLKLCILQNMLKARFNTFRQARLTP